MYRSNMLNAPLTSHRGRDPEGGDLEIWKESMGAYLFVVGPKDTEAVQGSMVRMAGSFHQEGRVVQGEFSTDSVCLSGVGASLTFV